VHNFCPVPIGAPRGHPEIWTLAARDERERESAMHHTGRTIRFAAEVGRASWSPTRATWKSR
jgi:hypothetical protein